jgi:hypothetical protein
MADLNTGSNTWSDYPKYIGGMLVGAAEDVPRAFTGGLVGFSDQTMLDSGVPREYVESGGRKYLQMAESLALPVATTAQILRAPANLVRPIMNAIPSGMNSLSAGSLATEMGSVGIPGTVASMGEVLGGVGGKIAQALPFLGNLGRNTFQESPLEQSMNRAYEKAKLVANLRNASSNVVPDATNSALPSANITNPTDAQRAAELAKGKSFLSANQYGDYQNPLYPDQGTPANQGVAPGGTVAPNAVPGTTSTGSQGSVEQYINMAKQFYSEAVKTVENTFGVSMNNPPKAYDFDTLLFSAQRNNFNPSQVVSAAAQQHSAEMVRWNQANSALTEMLKMFKDQYAPKNINLGDTLNRPGAGTGELIPGQSPQHNVVPMSQGGAALVKNTDGTYRMVIAPEQRQKVSPEIVKDFYKSIHSEALAQAETNIDLIASGKGINPVTGKKITKAESEAAQTYKMNVQMNAPAQKTHVDGGFLKYVNPVEAKNLEDKKSSLREMLRDTTRGGAVPQSAVLTTSSVPTASATPNMLTQQPPTKQPPPNSKWQWDKNNKVWAAVDQSTNKIVDVVRQ